MNNHYCMNAELFDDGLDPVKQTALDFVEAINAHDSVKITALMTDDHIFIDAYGNSESKEAMKQGWPGYFSWFPDYLIEVDEVYAAGNTVVLLGYAGGTFHGEALADNKNSWRLPAAWRVVVDEGLVKVWQVYADSKIPYEIINQYDNELS